MADPPQYMELINPAYEINPGASYPCLPDLNKPIFYMHSSIHCTSLPTSFLHPRKSKVNLNACPASSGAKSSEEFVLVPMRPHYRGITHVCWK